MHTITSAASHVAQGLPNKVTDPDPVDVGNISNGLDTLLGVIATIGPFVFFGGLLIGCLFLVVGMFSHGELKGVKYIVISIIAAVVFGGAATLMNLFVE